MKRVAYWDVTKGIAITAIVAGHASTALHDFVYTWHLAIFIFLTGYLYNSEKHGEHPWEYMGHKTGQNWTKYVCYSSIILFIYWR